MFGLAETDSDWTALRSPPLLTFSGDQPCSTATGRSMSAVASSQTKAVNGSRRPARAWNGAFITCLPLGADVLQTLAAASAASCGKDWTALAAVIGIADAGAFAAVDQVLGVGDHARRCCVFTPQPKFDIDAVVVIGLRRAAPVRAVRNFGAAAADDHADRARAGPRRRSPGRRPKPACHSGRRSRRPGRARRRHRRRRRRSCRRSRGRGPGTSRRARSASPGASAPPGAAASNT